MKKILFFIGTLSGGGAERVVSILASNLVNDFDVEVLTYYKEPITYPLDNRVRVTCVEENTQTKSKLKNIKFIKDYFNNNSDVIISFLAPFNMYALAINTFINKPIIVADRNDPNKVPTKALLRFIRNMLYKKANAVVVQTTNNKLYFDKYIKRDLYVIPNPIDIKDNLGLALKTTKQNRIVSVGRLEPQKNQLLLIDSFNEIHKEYKDYTLTIYGEGSYRRQLESRIKEFGLDDCVFLPGNSQDVFNKIADAQVFVLCSNYEGMPNALAEAMCLGLPCIATDVSGVKDLIIDEENGLIINTNSKEELVESIKRVLNSKQLQDKLATNAIKVSERLGVNSIVNTWEDIINKL